MQVKVKVSPKIETFKAGMQFTMRLNRVMLEARAEVPAHVSADI